MPPWNITFVHGIIEQLGDKEGAKQKVGIGSSCTKLNK